MSDAGAAREVEAAIARVLGAEQDAREAIDRARDEAAAIEEAARDAARRLEQRTDRRILRVRAAFERSLASALGDFDREAQQAQAPQALGDSERAAVEAAVARLAEALTVDAPAGAAAGAEPR